MKIKKISLGCILMTLTSCGVSPSQEAQTKTILNGRMHPQWTNIQENEELFYGSNIFQIFAGSVYVGTGFIMNATQGNLITNSHVATSLKYCSMFKLPCENFQAKNAWNTLSLKDIKVNDSSLDFATFSFDIVSQKKAFQKIEVQYSLEDTTKIHLVSLTHSQKMILSQGEVLSLHENERMRPHLKYNADTVPGMSGSPIFNASTNLLMALHFAGSEDASHNKGILFSKICEKYKEICE